MIIYLLLFLIVIVAPFGTIIHEMGHGMTAYILSADAVTLHIGIGSRVKTFAWRRLTIHLYGMYFIGGITKSIRNPSFSTREKISIALGGPLGNAVVAFLLLIIFYPVHNPYIRLFILFQGWLMIINIIPFQWKGKKSDGYTIMQIIRKRIRDKNDRPFV